MHAVFYLSVVFTGEHLVNYYLLFAVCNGIASAFYCVGYLTLVYDVSTDTNRIRWISRPSVNVIVLIARYMVGNAGIEVLPWVLLGSSALQIALYGLIEADRVPEPSHRTRRRGKAGEAGEYMASLPPAVLFFLLMVIVKLLALPRAFPFINVFH